MTRGVNLANSPRALLLNEGKRTRRPRSPERRSSLVGLPSRGPPEGSKTTRRGRAEARLTSIQTGRPRAELLLRPKAANATQGRGAAGQREQVRAVTPRDPVSVPQGP